MRGAEGRAVEQLALGQGAAGRRVDPGHRERLRRRQRRQQPGQALGQHGLARAGRPDHQEVVAPGRGDLERPAPDRLATHVGQVGCGRGAAGSARAGTSGQCAWPRSTRPQVGQRGGAVDVVPPDQRGLAHVAERHDQPERARWRRPGRSCPGRGAGTRSARARRRRRGPRLHAGCSSPAATRSPTAMGRSSPAPPLRTPDGRQVDRDPAQRPRQAAREHGGAHPVAGLAHRGVGQADDGEAGQPVRDVDLDQDRAPHGTGQCGGGDRGEHAGERSLGRSPVPDMFRTREVRAMATRPR